MYRSLRELTSGSKLSGDNLRGLFEECRANIDRDPVAFFVLTEVFRGLGNEYDEGLVETSRFDEVDGAMRAPLLALFDAAADERQARLADVVRAYLAIT